MLTYPSGESTMTVYSMHWESQLLSLAKEAFHSHVPGEDKFYSNQNILEQAYRHCANLTQLHSKTFYLASGLLPDTKRSAVRALYAFCRISDDLVDRSKGDAHAELDSWRKQTISAIPTGEDAVVLAWNDTCQKFQIPWRYAEQLLDGVAKDIVQTRYQTFNELATYCYGVACTVGLMSMHIIGYKSQEAFIYAIRLGVALQLTNILRDIGEDFRSGRIYLPQEELTAFELTEEDIANGNVDSRWREFMRFQIDRNRKLYADALPGVALLDPDGRFAIEAAGELYRAILNEIEKHDYNVFQYRASVSKWGKLALLPGVWWRANHPKESGNEPDEDISSTGVEQ
jgi:15-cis-phytoene synthase